MEGKEWKSQKTAQECSFLSWAWKVGVVETEAQNGCVEDPRSHSRGAVALAFKPSSEALVLRSFHLILQCVGSQRCHQASGGPHLR